MIRLQAANRKQPNVVNAFRSQHKVSGLT